MSFKHHLNTLSILIFLALCFSACSPKHPIENQQAATVEPEPTLTQTEIVPTPTMIPGIPENPFRLGIISNSPNSSSAQAANALAMQLAAQTGYSFDVKPVNNLQNLLKNIQTNDIHIFWLDPIPYLWANQNGLANAALLANHYGYYEYGMQFFVHSKDDFNIYFDPGISGSTASAAEALSQLSGKRPCWANEGSIAGHVLPVGILSANQIPIQDAVMTQSHSAVIRSLYITGICDFGATYAYTNDPRAASNVIQDLPDVQDKVITLWQSEAIIPNRSLVFHSNLDEQTRQDLMIAFLVLAKTPEGKSLLSNMTDYSIDDLKIIDDTYYDQLREYVSLSGLNLAEIIHLE